MAKHDESAQGTEAQRKAEAEAEKLRVATRNMHEKLRREGKIQDR